MAMKKPEEIIEDTAKKRLVSKGWSVDHCESVNGPGWPDMTCLRSRVSLLIETKAGTDTRPAQRNRAIELFKNNGVIVWGLKPAKIGYKLFKLHELINKEMKVLVFPSINAAIDWLHEEYTK